MKRLLIMTCTAAMIAATSSASTTVAHWTFGAHGLTDITGNNTIELENHGVTFADGGAVFNGNSYLVTKDPVELGATTKAFTIECWVWFDGANNVGWIFSPSNTAEKGSFHIYQNVDKGGNNWLYAQLRTANSSDTYQQQQDGEKNKLTAAHPHHIAYVVDAAKSGVNRAKLYFDGVQLSNTALNTAGNFSSGFGSRNLYIGISGNNGSPNNGFKGRIDDIRITDGALEPSQFLKSPTPNAPLAHWIFGSETPLVDATGNGNDLENNGVTFADGAAVFNGTGQYLKTASTLDLSAYRRATIECLCHMDSPSTFGLFFALENVSSTRPGSFVVYKNNYSYYAQFGTTGGWQQEGRSNVADSSLVNGWHHIAYVLDVTRADDDECVLYFDGAMQPQTLFKNKQILSALLNDKFCIGGGSTYGSDLSTTFGGKMTEVVVTPQVLTTNSFMLARYPPASSLIAYWDFAGSAGVWSDKSGNGHDLTAVNVSSKNGAANFNSASASLGASLDLTAFRSITVECFAKSSAAVEGAAFTSGDGSAAGSFGAFITNASARAEFVPYANGLSAEQAASGGADGEWHHYALVIDGDALGAEQARFYVDGVRAVSGAMASDATALPNGVFRIGGGYDGTAFSGLIDDVRITGSALDPGDFMQAADRTEAHDGLILIFR